MTEHLITQIVLVIVAGLLFVGGKKLPELMYQKHMAKRLSHKNDRL